MCCPIEWAVSNDSRKKDGRGDGRRRREWLYVNLLEKCLALKLESLSAQFNSRASIFGIFRPLTAARV